MCEMKPVAGNEKECLDLVGKYGLKFFRPGERIEEIKAAFPLLAEEGTEFCLRDQKALFVSDSSVLCEARWPYILARFRHACLLISPYEKVRGFIPVFHPMEFVVGQLLRGGGVAEAYRWQTRMHMRGFSPLTNWNIAGLLRGLNRRT